jgi:hypothetical protein
MVSDSDSLYTGISIMTCGKRKSMSLFGAGLTAEQYFEFSWKCATGPEVAES